MQKRKIEMEKIKFDMPLANIKFLNNSLEGNTIYDKATRLLGRNTGLVSFQEIRSVVGSIEAYQCLRLMPDSVDLWAIKTLLVRSLLDEVKSFKLLVPSSMPGQIPSFTVSTIFPSDSLDIVIKALYFFKGEDSTQNDLDDQHDLVLSECNKVREKSGQFFSDYMSGKTIREIIRNVVYREYDGTYTKYETPSPLVLSVLELTRASLSNGISIASLIESTLKSLIYAKDFELIVRDSSKNLRHIEKTKREVGQELFKKLNTLFE